MRQFADPCSLYVYLAALLDLPATGVPIIPARTTQPILLECCIPRDTVPGNYSGLFEVSASTLGVRQNLFQVAVRLEVWPITIPMTNASDAFTTMFSFNGADAPGHDGLTQWYPGHTAAELREAWFPFLSHYRVPADSSYSLGRPVAELEELVASGAKWVNLLDVGFTTVEDLEPIIANVSTSLNDSATLYTYCCDEMNQDDNATLYETFGAVKRKWPWLKTVATLNWDEMPLDVPLDVWAPTPVNRFPLLPLILHSLYRETYYLDQVEIYTGGVAESVDWRTPSRKELNRQAFLRAQPGREYFWYDSAAAQLCYYLVSILGCCRDMHSLLAPLPSLCTIHS